MSDPELPEHYNPGDLLWVKIGKYPYWPCMVSFDPNTGHFFKIKKGKQRDEVIYHVQYFGKVAQRGWTSGSVLYYNGKDDFYRIKNDLLRDATPSHKRIISAKFSVSPLFEKEWLEAVKEADDALSVHFSNRYEQFVFKYVYDYKKPDTTNGNSSKRHRKRKRESSKKPLPQLREVSNISGKVCIVCVKGSVNLTCTGQCRRSFHKECLGVLKASSDFKCVECASGYQTCYGCKTSGNTYLETCVKCEFEYHSYCYEKYYRYSKNAQGSICSRHYCFTCHKRNLKNTSSKGPFVECHRCPTVFHPTADCIPAGSVKLTASVIICPLHFLGRHKVSPQPVCNVTVCSECGEGGELICCESCPSAYHKGCLNGEVPRGDFFCGDCTSRKFVYAGMIVWAKAGAFRWWPAQIVDPESLPENVRKISRYAGEFPVLYFGTDEYFWTHKGRIIPYAEHHKQLKNFSAKHGVLDEHYELSLDEARSAFDEYILQQQKMSPSPKKPNHFIHIRVNRAVPPAVIVKSKQASCECNPAASNPCGASSLCLNRTMLMECPDDCCAGERCDNQRFRRRQYPEVKVIKTESRGWGLASCQFIPKDTFVIEYVGEVINYQEYQRRVNEMVKNSIQNYYFLYLDTARMIDAGPKGNLARFINHSCDPNCIMEKWSVDGDLRIGIFSTVDIQPGEELTFNYQSDKIEFEQKCFCGSSSCRGVIGQRRKVNKNKK